MIEKETYGPHLAWYTTVNKERLTAGNISVNLRDYCEDIRRKLGAKSVIAKKTTVEGMNGVVLTDAVWILYEPNES